MQTYHSNLSVGITGGACICLAFSLLILPIQWIIAWIIAALVHELCHGIAIVFCGGEITGLRLGQSGAIMEIGDIPPGREWLCTMAGPIGSSLLILLFPYFPRVAFCAMIHCAYNLLPIYPLDGGRALRCALSRCSEKTRHEICTILETITITSLALFSLYLTFCMKLGVIPPVVVFILWIRAKSGKTPCKEPTFRLQ